MDKESRIDRAPHLALGQLGEEFALEYLKHRKGYHIVARNVSIPLGRNLRGSPVVGEIDIVAYDGFILSFVEVKTRSSEQVSTAAAAVDRKKQRTISRTAGAYRRLLRLSEATHRFDLVTVVFEGRGSPIITLHKGYFNVRQQLQARGMS